MHSHRQPCTAMHSCTQPCTAIDTHRQPCTATHSCLLLHTVAVRTCFFYERVTTVSSVSSVSQFSSVSLSYVRLPCALLLRTGDNSQSVQFSQSVQSVYYTYGCHVHSFYERVTTVQSVQFSSVQSVYYTYGCHVHSFYERVTTVQSVSSVSQSVQFICHVRLPCGLVFTNG